METKKLQTGALISAFILLSLFIFSFINPETENQETFHSPPDPLSTSGRLLIGAICSYSGTGMSYYNEAGFNLTHVYVGTENHQFIQDPDRHSPTGNVIPNDHLVTGVDYGLLRQAAVDMYAHNQSRFFWQRPRIEWLAFGQSSIYQAENLNRNDKYWFYSFNSNATGHNHPGHEVQDQGATVKYCRTQNSTNEGDWVDSPGFVVDRLKANTEQCRNDTKDNPNGTNQWQEDHECTWIIKPKIRIPQGLPDETEVCKVYAVKTDGVTQKQFTTETTIKAKHFHQFGNPNPYNGDYIEEFYFNQQPQETPTGLKFIGDLIEDPTNYPWGHYWCYAARGDNATDDYNMADIQIEWLGNCDMWLDYVKVENDIADGLLNPNSPNYNTYNSYIDQEVDAISAPVPGTMESPIFNFYIELFEFNNIPCMAYVNKRIMQRSGNKIGLMADLLTFYNYHLPQSDRGDLYSTEKLRTMFFDKTEFPQVFIGDPYPLIANQSVNCGGTVQDQFSQIPNTLTNLQQTSGDWMFQPTPPVTYDTWLQAVLDTVCAVYEGGPTPAGDWLAGDFQFLMKHGNAMSKACNKPFIAMLQAHQWNSGEKDREPTTEEENLMTNLAISYGAKGIIYWGWGSWGNFTDCRIGGAGYGRGILEGDINSAPRYQNLYGEDKWESLKATINRLKQWEPYIMSFDNTKTSSYVYRYPDLHNSFQTDRTTLLANSYLSDVQTYPSDINSPGTPASVAEDNYHRFIQVATFKNSALDQTHYEYFMIVNKRCSPIDPNWNDGRRDVKIQIKPNYWASFANFTNYKITDLGTGLDVATFINTNPQLIDLGWFSPGEGRLYRIAPVMEEGGTLIANETIFSEPDIYINGIVNNGGHNISITQGNDIVFRQNGHINMRGGSLQIGDLDAPQHEVYINVQNNSQGALFAAQNCNYVKLYNTEFTADYINGAYVAIWNTAVTDIQKNKFTCPDNTSAVFAYAVYGQAPSKFTFNVANNEFDSHLLSNPVLQGNFAGGIQLPVYIVDNSFVSADQNSTTTAIMLNNAAGGIIRGNHFTGYSYAINSASSNLPMYANNISSSQEANFGFFGTSNTVFDFHTGGGYTLGANIVSGTAASFHGIDVDNSYFLMNNGNNTFNINPALNSYHMYGTFPSGDVLIDLDITGNCFEQNLNPSSPVYDVSWSSGGQINFTNNGSSCLAQGPAGTSSANDLGDGIFDTVRNNSQPALNAYDSLGLQMRLRNYVTVINLSKRILETAIDSIYSVDAVSKLYASSTLSDTSQAGISVLKDYLSGLILANPANSSLVRACNYYIQKCKVLLKQYSSALAGFQQIIDNNPYSYEALVAHWDYMATHLLDSLSGGAERGDGDDDRHGNSRFSKEQKKVIKSTVLNVFEKTKENNRKYIDKLKEESENGNEHSKRLLQQKKVLSEVVQQRTPHNIFEHMQIINDDLKQVFGSPKAGTNSVVINIVPKVFKLYQNYPNPFNPVAVIKYDLPKDAKVNIKVYDLLGREVKNLVNEFQKAGSYSVQFDGTNLASGVYFYRIEAGKYVDSKKMVLVK